MADTQFGMNGWLPERLGDLSGKTFAITGASSGTGREAARILLSKGASVVMLNRNADKTNAVISDLKQELGADINIGFIQLDLAELDSVRSAAAEVLSSVPQIDALICNAAIAQVPKQVLTQDGFESHLATNHYGHFLLCGLLFDLLEKSNGRVVVMSSLGYKMGLKTIQFDDMNWGKNYQPNSTYCHSKLAQMMFAYELQDKVEAAGKNVQVYVCHPGASRTSLIETSGSNAAKFMFSILSKLPLVQTAEQGAYTQILCATEDGLDQRGFYGPTGTLESKGPVGSGTLHPYAYEKDTMVRLWKVSEDAVDFQWQI